MKKPSFLLVALLCLPAVSHANDTSVVGIGGRWRIVTKEHPSIRMVSEKIDLTIASPDKYTTVAEFVFQNNGPATKVKMGFPESGYGDIDVKAFKSQPSFTHFQTWVDGVPFVATRHYTSPGEETFDALWVKTVPFKKGQIRKVRVSYQSSWGEVSTFVAHFITYDFTGGNWRGNVATSVLTVHLDVPGTYLVSTDEFKKDKPQFVRRGHQFIYTWHNWQAQQSFAFRFDTTLRNWLETGALVGLPVNIEAPGGKLSEAVVGYLPSGVVRNGQTFVNLRSWLDWAATNKHLSGSYDAKTRTFSISDGKRSVGFSASDKDCFTATARSGSNLFVGASRLESDFGAKFQTDLKAHKISFFK